VLLVALWGLLALGAGRDRAHDRGLAVATCGVMALGLLLWPSHSVRYLVPLLPLLLLFAARGVRRGVVLAAGVLGLIGRPLPARLAPILLLALLVPYLRWGLRAPDASAREMTAFDPWRGFARTLAWVDAEVPADAVVVTRYPEDVFVRTGRQALPLERALRHPEADALNEGPLWLVRDAVEGPQRDDANDAVALSRAGGRIRYVESDSGTEVWILPVRALQRLEEARKESPRA
jgi:hypothetical protein